MPNRIKRILCIIRRKHDYQFISGIADLHGQSITDEYKCERCGKHEVIENYNFKPCNCEECVD